MPRPHFTELNLKTAFPFWKRINVFRSYYTRENWKPNNHRSFGIHVWGNLGQRNCKNAKPTFSNSSSLKGVFEKPGFCDELVWTKDQNFSGVASWTGHEPMKLKYCAKANNIFTSSSSSSPSNPHCLANVLVNVNNIVAAKTRKVHRYWRVLAHLAFVSSFVAFPAQNSRQVYQQQQDK